MGLAGVSQYSLDIDDGRRSAGAVEPVLEKLGLKRADPEEYRTWVARERISAAKETAGT